MIKILSHNILNKCFLKTQSDGEVEYTLTSILYKTLSYLMVRLQFRRFGKYGVPPNSDYSQVRSDLE